MVIKQRTHIKFLTLFLFFCASHLLHGASVELYITDENGKALTSKVYVTILEPYQEYVTDQNGYLKIENIKKGGYTFFIETDFFNPKYLYLYISDDKNTVENVKLSADPTFELDPYENEASKQKTLQGDIADDHIVDTKKNSVHKPDDSDMDKSGNGAVRSLFYKTQVNIIQIDGAGLQLGIGGRGLDPHRSSNFNIRQNGYDISADALGYPESYYTPPVEALESVELLRGAASLQYGTQFGGVVNFKLRSGFDKHFEIVTRQTGGSFGYFNSFNSLGGTTKNGVKYYAYFQSKTGDDYRENSQFNLRNFYGHVEKVIGDRFKIGIDQTYMTYLAHQAGGLTDKEFAKNPRQSNRDRNWFQVKWYVPSLSLEYYPIDNLYISSKFFGLIGERNSVGNLGSILREDTPDTERDLILGGFKNVGNETRAILDYKIKNRKQYLATGVRTYFSNNSTFQGIGSTGDNANFTPEGTDNFLSDYENPNRNFSAFAENLFHIGDKFTTTLGARIENIKTSTNGSFRVRQQDLAGNDLVNFTVEENRELPRTFLITGIGAGYKIKDSATTCTVYSNLAQNYRSVTFSDLRVVNPSFLIDSTLSDEDGFNFDLGIKGEKPGLFSYDVSGFLLFYNGRIGEVLKEVEDPIINTTTKRFRTNISDARILGLEGFAEINLLRLFNDSTKNRLNFFVNGAYIKSEYINSEDASVQGNQVEYVPEVNFRTGLRFRRKKLGASILYSYTSQQFSDATNTIEFPDAIFGIIPSYHVVDISGAYQITDHFKLESGINNLTNSSYFTKRTTGYPGPGILPASGRSFYLTLEYRL